MPESTTGERDGRPHVVIVGGGFGGLRTARCLRRAPVRITLVDRNNYHLFQPLLYQVATAALSVGDIAFPIRAALRAQRNVRVLLGDVRGINLDDRRIMLESGELAYDHLVVATGVTHSYFGQDAWAEHAPGLKTIEDAFEIRRRVLLAYEAAERESDPEARREWLTFVVVGAGPTGVELAGALSEIGRRTVAKDFRTIDPTSIRVVLLEGADRVLGTYHEQLSARAQRLLESAGVEVRTGTLASAIDDSGVEVDGERIEARTVLWAAGVEASPLAKALEAPLDGAGRVRVESDLSVPGHPEVFVIGDLASVRSDGKDVPGVAPAAIQMGTYAARRIVDQIEGRTTTPFRYRDKGAMATIGRSAAIVEVGRVRLAGLIAWLVWGVIHLFFLIGVRNRLAVFFGWTWSYITFQRGARLITGKVEGLPEVTDAN